MLKNSTLNFKPAALSIGKSWEIVYHCEDPATGKLHRFREKVNHIKKVSERKRYAAFRLKKINEQLYSGWNPFIEKDSPRGFTEIAVALDVFLTKKCKELKPNSVRTYRSVIRIFNKWLKQEGFDKMPCASFNKLHALNYLDYIDSRVRSNESYNNQRRVLIATFNWLIHQLYCSVNHFEKTSKRKKEEKERVPIFAETRARIKDYFAKENPDMLIVSLLTFHALLRPGEISQLRRSYFDLEKNIIRVPGQITKSGKSRKSTIGPGLKEQLVKWNFNGATGDDFIFPSKTSKKIAINQRRFTQSWDEMRTALKLNKKMQLYSLRDSGIIQLIQDGVSLDRVRYQAGHSSLTITNGYAQYVESNGNEQIILKSTGF